MNLSYLQSKSMNSYNTVIVEDEGPARRRLENMVSDHERLTLVASLTSGREAMKRIPALHPDLLLLDIQLKDKTAFEVLQFIGNDIRARIIFITAYDKYAIQAFDVGAVDYLLKPYDDNRFNKAISRILEKENNAIDQNLLQILEKQIIDQGPATVIIPEGNKQHFFTPDDIVYIRSDRYYVHVHTMSDSKLIRITLKKLMSLLPTSFIRINKSTIINQTCIREIEYQKSSSRILLTNGVEVRSSKTYNENLKN